MTIFAAFDFLEIADEVRPVDKFGALQGLSAPGANTMPPVVDGKYGRAREFGDGLALSALESTQGSMLLNRGVTMLAFLDFKIGDYADTDMGVLFKRFASEGSGQLTTFVCEITRVGPFSINIKATWDGTSTSGVTVDLPVGVFMIGITREWVSETETNIRYFVNGDLVGTETESQGVISDSVAGEFVLGYDPLTGTDTHLPDGTTIEIFQIGNEVLCDEEIRQYYRRIAVHKPSGYKVLKAFLPPGEAWNRNPDSAIQRWIASEGDGLGCELADIERFREDFLPDRAYGGSLEDWERITGQEPKPSDTIQARRDRVLGFLRIVLGFSIADIKTALEPLFGLDSSDIEILEFTGVKSDDFTVDDVTAPPSRLWNTRVGGGSVTVNTGSSSCGLFFDTGDDGRYYKQTPEPNGSPLREASIGALQGYDTNGSMVIVTISSAFTAADVFGGIFMRDASGDGAIFWGLSGASEDLSYMRYVDGEMSVLTVIAAAAGAPQRLAIRYNGGGLYDLGRIIGGLFVVDVVATAGPASPRWGGIVGVERVATASVCNVAFTDAQIYEANSSRPYTFIAKRDSALPGTYDLEAAQAQLDRQAPAHTLPSVIDSDQGFSLGPAGAGLLGSSPLFPIV